MSQRSKRRSTQKGGGRREAPIPIRRYTTPLFVLEAMGLLLAAYLAVKHLALLKGGVSENLLCRPGSFFDCNVVQASPSAGILGIPNAILGVTFYLILGLATRFAASPKTERPLPFFRVMGILSLFALLYDLFLLGVMIFDLRTLCLFCVGTYLVNIGILWVSFKATRAFPKRGSPPESFLATLPPSFVVGALFITVVTLGLYRYHLHHTFKELEARFQHYLHQLPSLPIEELNINDQPSKGATDPTITIVEFSDFLCPYCKRASEIFDVLLRADPGRLRVVYRNYPLEGECNPSVPYSLHRGSCRLAMAGECAQLQGLFWPLHDRIFKKGPHYPMGELLDDAREVGLDIERFEACLDGGEGREAVEKDISEGSELEIRGTPTIFVNGRRIPVLLPIPNMVRLFDRIEQIERGAH